MKLTKILLAVLLLMVFSVGAVDVSAQEAPPTIRAILFYSPTCGHCHKVITEDLPPLFDQYGDQFLVLFIDITSEGGGNLFYATATELGYSQQDMGVPFMVVGEMVMIGSEQIPAELPGLIEDGLANGGIDWPPSPTLIEALKGEGFIDPETGAAITPTPDPVVATAQAEVDSEEQPTEASEESVPTEAPAEEVPTDMPAPTEAEIADAAGSDNLSVVNTDIPLEDSQEMNFGQFGERFSQDPVANSIAVVILLGMIGLVIWIGIQFMQANTPKMWPEYILPILLVLGLAIAIYLATIEVSGNEAICGPVGDCNAVQESQYSKVFGIPVAVLGIIGYVLIGSSWLVSRQSSGNIRFFAKMAMFLTALMGLLFFIYLTFLEPFVIGATCAWCISSAVIFSLINLYTTPVALNAWAEMDFDYDDEEEENA